MTATQKLLRTPLYAAHIEMGAKMVDFAGWEMPIQYQGVLDEHHIVRTDAGMFDVSHMLTIDITGNDAKKFLAYIAANDIAKLQQNGKALYTCFLNENGGVIDDLIIYLLDDNSYRLVVNAARANIDLDWLKKHSANYAVTIKPRRDLAIIAIQGPAAINKTMQVLPENAKRELENLKRFSAVEVAEFFIARTGYTGEDGLEIILPQEAALDFWQALAQAGVSPVGLGARDTLRLEAGMNLYGNDMDESTSPLIAGLGWTIAIDEARDFIGKAALVKQRQQGVAQKQVGIVLSGRGILRQGQKVMHQEREIGEISSGSFAPTLKKSIAFAKVTTDAPKDVSIVIRNKQVAAQIVDYPFVKNGKANF